MLNAFARVSRNPGGEPGSERRGQAVGSDTRADGQVVLVGGNRQNLRLGRGGEDELFGTNPQASGGLEVREGERDGGAARAGHPAERLMGKRQREQQAVGCDSSAAFSEQPERDKDPVLGAW